MIRSPAEAGYTSAGPAGFKRSGQPDLCLCATPLSKGSRGTRNSLTPNHGYRLAELRLEINFLTGTDTKLDRHENSGLPRLRLGKSSSLSSRLLFALAINFEAAASGQLRAIRNGPASIIFDQFISPKVNL